MALLRRAASEKSGGFPHVNFLDPVAGFIWSITPGLLLLLQNKYSYLVEVTRACGCAKNLRTVAAGVRHR